MSINYIIFGQYIDNVSVNIWTISGQCLNNTLGSGLLFQHSSSLLVLGMGGKGGI